MARRMMGMDRAHSRLHRLSQRVLEPCQDVLMLALGLLLFGLMVRTGYVLFEQLSAPVLEFRLVISEVLFILVMVEMLRLVMTYIHEHRVAVDFMVELGIVATLREIVLLGIVELDWKEIASLSVFLLALGALLRFGDLRPSRYRDIERSDTPSRIATDGPQHASRDRQSQSRDE